jgi:predicted RNase H-like HicB family nuclease
MKYAVVVHHAEEGGYWAEVPTLRGCFAQGETIDDVVSEMRATIQSHVSALRADGQAVPVDDVLPELALVEV